MLCGEHNITVGNLIENFIGDLVNGTYTNGSDERDYARSYFERCWFGMFPEKSLLNFLLSNGYDVYEDLIEWVECITEQKNDKSDYSDEEKADIRYEVSQWEQIVDSIRGHYLEENPQADWDEEYKKVVEWYDEKERLRSSAE